MRARTPDRHREPILNSSRTTATIAVLAITGLNAVPVAATARRKPEPAATTHVGAPKLELFDPGREVPRASRNAGPRNTEPLNAEPRNAESNAFAAVTGEPVSVAEAAPPAASTAAVLATPDRATPDRATPDRAAPDRATPARWVAGRSSPTRSASVRPGGRRRPPTRQPTAPSYGSYSAPNGSAAAVVAYATAQVGHPYRRGGSGPAFDCSGLTQQAYLRAGVRLPHQSGAQRSAGRPIGRAELQPGDLILYRGHVGIAVGGGQMVHAANPRKGVVRAAIYGSPIGYRRLVG